MHTPHLIAFKENTRFSGNAEPFFDSLLLFWVGDGIFVKDVTAAFHTGVAVLFEGFPEFLPECAFDGLVVGTFGEVGDAVRVGLDIVEFFFGAFAHAELPVGLITLFFFFDDARFGGRVVDVAVIDFGVASRPAVGFKISQVEVMVIANAADGIAHGAGTADVVAFFAGNEGGALRVNDARIIRFEDGHEAFASDLGMDVNARGFEEGGGEVHEIDEVVNYSARFDHAFPHGGQWHVVGYFVELAFHARKGHAIV